MSAKLGQLTARALFERACDVSGIDAPTKMVALCRSASPGQDWTMAAMHTLSLGRSFHRLLRAAWSSDVEVEILRKCGT